MHRSTLLIVPLAFLTVATAQTGQNINHARTGTATQSADHPSYPAGVASRAIDGNRNGAWLDDSSNLTAAMAAPWWQVALAGPSLVHEIVIYPRADNSLSSMRDMLVELKSASTVVWSQWCCTGGAYPPPGVATRLLLPPGGLSGDTVRISRPNVTNGAISLTEVEALQIAPITPVNWAIYGTATQSSTAGTHTAANAIDGNTDSYINNNSCALTNTVSGTDWWEVALPRRRYDEVRIWPTTWSSTMGDYLVRGYDGSTVQFTQAFTNAPVTGPQVVALAGLNLDIDRVRVFRNGYFGSLHIAEVEVINYSALDAEAKPFGIGCLGSIGVPVLRATSAPQVSANFAVSLANVPTVPSLAVIASGLSYTASGPLPLPFDLGVIGGAGCQVYVSADYTQVAIAAAGIATSTLAIPNNTGLLGFSLFQQAIVLDAPANALGLTTSNALAVRIGL